MNPWDVVPSEPVESTGWANFENFENTLSIENTVSEDKRPCDEFKEKTSEATLTTNLTTNLTEKNMTSSENIGDNSEKSRDYIDNQIVGTELVTKTDLDDSKSDEYKMISANENANPRLELSDSVEPYKYRYSYRV